MDPALFSQLKAAFLGALVTGFAGLLISGARLVFRRGFLQRMDTLEANTQLLAKRSEDVTTRLKMGAQSFEHQRDEIRALRVELRRISRDVAALQKEKDRA